MENLARACMPFLYFLESIRNPVFDFIFDTITHLGEETFFLVVAITVFWCINKREGYFILITGLAGTVVNQVAKLFFRIPRPWDLDPDFDIIESARKEATGYSFPSGHTQNIAGTYGSICACRPKKWKTVLCVSIIVLVAFSRMYLGVHTPLDVVVSLLVALVFILVIRPVFKNEERMDKFMPWIIGILVLLSTGFLAYVLLVSGDTTLDPHNYQSGLKNACTLFGCTAGLIPVYILDRKIINFKTDGRWYAQIIKLLLGLGIVLLIKEGLRSPLELLFDNIYIARAIRYFIIVMFAGTFWPLTFDMFAKLRIECMEKFSAWVSSKLNFKKKA